RQALAQLGLVVAAAFAAAVQEQHHRPRMPGRPAVRHEDLVAIGLAMQLQRARHEMSRFGGMTDGASGQQAKEHPELSHGDVFLQVWGCIQSSGSNRRATCMATRRRYGAS